MSRTETNRNEVKMYRRSKSAPGLAMLVAGLLIFVLAVVAPLSARETVTLKRGAAAPFGTQTGAVNNWLNATTTAQNNGGADIMTVASNTTATNRRRGLILFDLSSLPGGAGIKLATLRLFKTTAPATTRTINVDRVTSFWTESGSSWANRMTTTTPATVTAWGAVGGDANTTAGTGRNAASVSTTNNIFTDWTVTGTLQSWFSGATGHAGWLINDNADTASSATLNFASHFNATDANRPELVIEFMQQVQGLSATAGSGTATLNWSYPTLIGTEIAAYTGVVIVRKTSAPVPNDVTLTDGAIPALCADVETISGGTSTVVFVSSSLPTTFLDNNSHGCGATANGTTYFYKVFLRTGVLAAATQYSSNPCLPAAVGCAGSGGSNTVPEAAATPSATAANQQGTTWVRTVGSAAFTPAGLKAGETVVASSNSALLPVFDTAGNSKFAPWNVQGAVGANARPPVIEAPDSTTGVDTAYIASADGFLYAYNAETGELLWAVNPTGFATPATTNNFTGGAAVFLKAFAGAGYTLTHDLVVVCTGQASDTANRCAGVNANTGERVWQTTVAMGASVSTPVVDYVNNAIYVTALRANAGNPESDNVRKLNPNTGAQLAGVRAGNGSGDDISSSASMSAFGQVLIVGNDDGELNALRVDTLVQIATTAIGVGAITDFPIVRNTSSPYLVILRAATGPTIRSLNFNCTASTGIVCTAGNFTANWNVTITGASTPITTFGLSPADKIYVGTTTAPGGIQQRTLATGALEGIARVVPGTPGAPTLDTILNRIYVGAASGRIFAYGIPW